MAVPERKERSSQAPDEAERTDERGEFARFEDLARKLLRVPKKELDERLKKSRR
jgi:hypothetical protein